MTDHYPLPVAGYTAQSHEKVAIVNENKAMEEKILRQLDMMGADTNFDPRWVAIARTQIESGFMAMNRAVFRPQRLMGDV